MTSNARANENIELCMPVNAAYVSAVRLTASSIANRMQFDIDEIEDIKAAVSEACNYIIKKASHSRNNSFKVNFLLFAGSLEIQLSMDDITIPDSSESEMSLLMINALMDDMNLNAHESKLRISMHKKHKENAFKGV